MRQRHRRDVADMAETLADSTSASPAQRWIIGVGLAFLLALYSIVCLVTQRAMFLRGRPLGIIEMQGANAVALGILYLSAALFMHCHWFWSDHPDYYGYAQLGKIGCLLGIVCGLGYLFYNVVFLS